MAEITGTIKSITLLRGPDNQSADGCFTYHITLDSASTTAGDTGTIEGIPTAIATTFGKSGKTLQLRDAMRGHPGLSAGGTAVYATLVTVDTADLNYSLGGPTAVAVVAGCSSVGITVQVDEASA